MKKKILISLIIILSIPIISNILSIAKLYIGNVKITKAYFTPYYFSRIEQDENEIAIFKEYMISNGWEFTKQDGGLLNFSKESKTKEILVSDIISLSNN